jgi:hypothetical protein
MTDFLLPYPLSIFNFGMTRPVEVPSIKPIEKRRKEKKEGMEQLQLGKNYE